MNCTCLYSITIDESRNLRKINNFFSLFLPHSGPKRYKGHKVTKKKKKKKKKEFLKTTSIASIPKEVNERNSKLTVRSTVIHLDTARKYFDNNPNAK